MLYRVLRDLSTGHKRGEIVSADRFNNYRLILALLEVRAIAEITTPPLAELPGWELRAEKLAQIGVVTVQDFLDADDDRIMATFGHRRRTVLNKWKEEAKQWLSAEIPGKK